MNGKCWLLQVYLEAFLLRRLYLEAIPTINYTNFSYVRSEMSNGEDGWLLDCGGTLSSDAGKHHHDGDHVCPCTIELWQMLCFIPRGYSLCLKSITPPSRASICWRQWWTFSQLISLLMFIKTRKKLLHSWLYKRIQKGDENVKSINEQKEEKSNRCIAVLILWRLSSQTVVEMREV